LRIWSAACSTGQEPYTIAMLLAEQAPRLTSWTVHLLATDISDAVLAKARAGIYAGFEVQRGLPPFLLQRYFVKNGDNWQVSPQLRPAINFQNLNLLDDFGRLGQFDVIFCRYVLIYFDAKRKADILNRMARALSPHGTLFLGASENLLNVETPFHPNPASRGVFTLHR
jgi:chemotaxis protein methyltransferase CheR